jgi:nitrogen regulatory protein PII 2
MKEVLAVIRMEMISKTKEALLNDGFPALNCRKVLGRGKKKVDFAIIENMINGAEIPSPVLAQALSEGHRLIPKRLLSLIVKDEEVSSVVDTIMKVNSKGKAGDGKIFILPVSEVVRVRTGESGEEAI